MNKHTNQIAKHNPLPPRKKNLKLLVSLSGVVVGMFVFAIWGMPPFYNAICKLTGLNGKVIAPASLTDISANRSSQITDKQRMDQHLINVQFIADTEPNMPWSFQPDLRSVRLPTGEQKQITFTVHNPTDQDMVGQAIPSISPAQAVAHLKKIECFCFQQQPLKAGETRQLTLVFYLDKEMPSNIPTVTLAYKLFDMTKPSAG